MAKYYEKEDRHGDPFLRFGRIIDMVPLRKLTQAKVFYTAAEKRILPPDLDDGYNTRPRINISLPPPEVFFMEPMFGANVEAVWLT